MVSVAELRSDVNSLLNSRGQIIRIRTYTQTIVGGAGSYYDSAVTLSASGSQVWTSGLQQEVGQGRRSSYDAVLVQQGLLRDHDIKLYVAGSHSFSGAAIKIGIGSPPINEYSIVDGGVHPYFVMGSPIYTKLFLRKLSTGSLYGE